MLRAAYGEGSPKPTLRSQPSRSATIACFNSNENMSMPINTTTTQRHLPRPSTLLDRRRVLFPRSITFSEGVIQKLADQHTNSGECSDRMPLLHQQNLTVEMFTNEHPPNGEPPPPYEVICIILHTKFI